MRVDQRSLLPVAVLAIGVVLWDSAEAGSRKFESGDHCSYGDAKMIAQAYYALGNAGPSPWSGYGALTACEFRAFYSPPSEYCFCEHDNVVGGDNHSTTEPRSEWLFASVDAEFDVTPSGVIGVEPFITQVEGLRTSGREDGLPEHTIRRHFGAILTDLVPGIYDVTIQYTFGGLPLFADHTFMRVLPHEDAHDDGLGIFGTAVCPQELECDDGIDEDGDGDADCADYNCKRNAWGEFDITETPCFAGTYVDLGDELTTPLWAGSTAGASDDWVFLFDPQSPVGGCGWPGGGDVGDAAAHWTVPETGVYDFDLVAPSLFFPGSRWTYLGVATDTASWCSQGPIQGVPLEAGEVVTIVVDGVNVFDFGPFVVNADFTEE